MSRTRNKAWQKCDYYLNETIKKAGFSSCSNQGETRAVLKNCFRTLHQQGFIVTHVKGLKPKHIHQLVAVWKEKNLSSRTQENYLSKLRWLCRHTNRQQVVHNDPRHYGIKRESRIPETSKAIINPDFSRVKDERIRLALELQYAFGLRRCEALKFTWSQANINNTSITLKPSWTKGGVGRSVRVRSDEHRALLEKLKAIIPKGGSLIPPNVRYVDQIKHYNDTVKKAGLNAMHGLRHACAQKEYRYLTDKYTGGKGWDCSFQGGPHRFELTKAQRSVDVKVRLEISAMLGHQRLSVTEIYLGK